VAATWTLGRGRDEREALLLVRVWANFSSARAATSLVAMGRLGLRALLMASRTWASVSFFLRRRSAAAADLAVRSTWRWPERYELRALSRAGRGWGFAGGMEERDGCESLRLMSWESVAERWRPGIRFVAWLRVSVATRESGFLGCFSGRERVAGSPGLLREDVDFRFSGDGGLGPPNFLFTSAASFGRRDIKKGTMISMQKSRSSLLGSLCFVSLSLSRLLAGASVSRSCQIHRRSSSVSRSDRKSRAFLPLRFDVPRVA